MNEATDLEQPESVETSTGQPLPCNRLLCSAYDEGGNRRVRFPVQVGDVVDWKNNGVVGYYRACVVKVNEARVRLCLTHHDGLPLDSLPLVIVKPRFLAVYRGGKRVSA